MSIARSLPALLLFPVLLIAAGPPVSDPRAVALLAQVRALQPRIEKARELKFLAPVKAEILVRVRGELPGIQGYYDTKKKTLYVYDDVKDSYRTGTLVHEMVHALQDQHFGLSRQDDAPLDSDAALARAALIEGDATLTMIEVLEKEQPFVAKMLSTTLEKSRNLRNAFLYGIGAKYVQALKKKGGWDLVNQAYHFPPATTAAILHPESKVRPINLGPGPSLGEFGIIRMLGKHPASQAEAVQAATGWRGDRTVTDNKGTGWVVAYTTPEQASRFFRSLVALRKAEHPVTQSLTDSPTESAWQAGEMRIGIALKGTRVQSLIAPDAPTYRKLIDRLEGPPRITVYSRQEKRTLTLGELTDRLLEADLICVGETHDSEIDHQVQLMVLRALHARDDRLGVGMEMFQRPFQRVLDRYIEGAIDEKTMLGETEYRKRWGYAWDLYRPIVDFCKRNHVPLAGLNIGDELRKPLSLSGHARLTAEQKKQLGEIDFQVKAHREHWFDRLGKMHGHGEMGPEARERMYQVMTAWDEYMADSAARFQKERNLRRMVILAGSGHIERGFGIPDRAVKRTGGRVLSCRIVVGGTLDKLRADPTADFILLVE